MPAQARSVEGDRRGPLFTCRGQTQRCGCCGACCWGADPASLAQLADELLPVHELGVELAVVIGGGNFFRSQMAEGWGIGRAEADNIGMLGTVMNALMLGGSDGAASRMYDPCISCAAHFLQLRVDGR